MPRLCLSVPARLVGVSFLGWLLWLSVASWPSVAAPSQGKFYALLIGINEYTDGIKPLQYAVRDAEALHAALIRAHGLSPSQAKAQFRLLLNREATKQAIKDSLRKWLRKRLTPADTVLIFFAGHGKDHDGLTYWVTADTTKKNLDYKGISHEDLSSEVRYLNTEKVLIFVDACHSGFGLRGMRDDEDRKLNHANFQGKGRVILASSRQSQESGEDDSLQHGFFTYALLEALQGKADTDNDGKVDLFEVYKYLYHRVVKLAKEKKNHTQNPVFHSQISGKERRKRQPPDWREGRSSESSLPRGVFLRPTFWGIEMREEAGGLAVEREEMIRPSSPNPALAREAKTSKGIVLGW